MNLIDEIKATASQFQAIRRDLHTHPELSFQEFRTSDRVNALLQSWGIPTHRGFGGTGLVGIIKGKLTGSGRPRSIGLRADMDALPVQEINTFAHRSAHEGRMHACGHDGHTAMLLAAAHHLAHNPHFYGTVVLIFQPAEEHGGGAQKMIQDGVLAQFPCDAVFAIHNWPGIAVGQMGIAFGPAMASTSEFDITVHGKGAHAAMPNLGIDPVFTAVQIAQGLQGLITRGKRPIDHAVLSITTIQAGKANNVIADQAFMAGTVRTFDEGVTDLIEAGMKRVAELTAQAHGARATVQFQRNYPATINHTAQAEFAAQVAEEVLGEAQVLRHAEPTMGGEDFSYFLQACPGAYLFLGNGTAAGDHRDAGHGAGPCTLHNASYDFNDELIPIGASFWVRLVERFLHDTAGS